MRIDFHVHISETRAAEMNGLPIQMGQEDILEGMQQAGVDVSVLLNMAPGGDLEKTRAQNDWLASICRDSTRFVGFGSVHPADGDAALQELDRCARVLGLRGLKLHPNTQQFDCADPAFIAVLRRAGELGLPVIIDTYSPFDDSQPSKLVKAVMACPDTTLCLAHVGSYRFLDFAVFGFVKKHTGFRINVYFDLCASIVTFFRSPFQDQFRWVTEQLGPDNLLWGSDFPFARPSEALEAIQGFGYDPAWMPRITGGNAARLLRLPQTNTVPQAGLAG